MGHGSRHQQRNLSSLIRKREKFVIFNNNEAGVNELVLTKLVGMLTGGRFHGKTRRLTSPCYHFTIHTSTVHIYEHSM